MSSFFSLFAMYLYVRIALDAMSRIGGLGGMKQHRHFSVAAVASVVVAGAVVAADTAADVAVVVNNDGDGAYGGPMDKEQLSKGCC